MSAVSTDRWTCPRPGCDKTVTVTGGSQFDVAAALDAVRERHRDGHLNGRVNIDGTATSRRASKRAAARRKSNEES